MNNFYLKNFFKQEILDSPTYIVNGVKGMIKLDAMENPFTLDENTSKELGLFIAKSNLNRYPTNELYNQTIKSIREYTNLEDNLELMLGNGSDEIISILSCVLEDNSYILSPVPSFIMYKVSASLSRLNFIGVNLDNYFDIDIKAMKKSIDEYNPKLIYLAYPNNPTGKCFSEQSIVEIINYAKNSLIIIDEAYQPFTLGKTFLNKLSQIIENNPNVLVMRTLSKLGLAGLRLGYIAGHKEFINQINKARPPYNINSLTQKAVQFLLPRSNIFEQQAHIICAERKYLKLKLEKFGHVYESDANFLLVKMNKDANIIESILKSQGILVKNASNMHSSLDNCLRISVGTFAENNALIYALQEINKY